MSIALSVSAVYHVKPSTLLFIYIYEEFNEASQQGSALKCVIMDFGRATASEECKQLTWFSWHVVSDTCRLTLTDWLRLWETSKGCEPVSVGVCDCICLSMRLCADKSTDVCQIDKVFCSIKAVGYLSLKSVTAVDFTIFGLHILFACSSDSNDVGNKLNDLNLSF